MKRNQSVAILIAALAAACNAPEPKVAGCAEPAHAQAKAEAAASATASAATPPAAVDAADPRVRAIVAAARGKTAAFDKLRTLTDGVGHRLSGTPELDRAVAWAVAALEADGHENVHTEKVMVPHWERGAESLEVVTPKRRTLAILGLGGTVATPRAGLEGEVVVVRTWDELEKAGAAVKDKIVLFDVIMRPHDEEKGSGYGEVVQYRGKAASRAAKLGAKAVLVRTLATASLKTPHTGAMDYEEGVAKIPAASIAIEDAAYLARLVGHGDKPRVRLKLGARMLPDAPSANVVAELRGSEKPDEIVLIGAHLDSWDVGQGAHDDGAGCVIVMQALTTLRSLKLRPKRTIRVVLFTNEENGLRGGEAYAKEHASEVPKIVAALESDFGGYAPDGFTFQVPPERTEDAKAYLAALIQGLDALGPLKLIPYFAGADIMPIGKLGTPGIGYLSKGTHYFDIHHSEADTLDKVDPKELADGVAAVAGLAFGLADAEVSFAELVNPKR